MSECGCRWEEGKGWAYCPVGKRLQTACQNEVRLNASSQAAYDAVARFHRHVMQDGPELQSVEVQP